MLRRARLGMVGAHDMGLMTTPFDVTRLRGRIGPEVESIVGRGHYAVEEAMKNSGVPWCVLSPGLFMQNTFAQAASITPGSLAEAVRSS